MRTQQDKLAKEISDLALECNVTYKWAGDYGLIAEIMGNGAYLLLMGKEYTEPKEPPKYPTDLDKNSSKDEQDRAIAELDEEKIAYAMRKGFHRGVGANIREALDEQYYKQLWHNKTAYKMLMAKEYINHLDKKWCKLTTAVIKKMKQDYYQPWHFDTEHVTDFTRCLDEDQGHLADNGSQL